MINIPKVYALTLTVVVTVPACVSLKEHEQMLAELGKAQRAAAESAAAFEALKKQRAVEVTAMEEEQTWLAKELVSAQHGITETQIDLQSTQYHLTTEQQSRQKAEQKLSKLRTDYRELERASNDLRWECNLLQIKVEDLAGRLELAKQAMRNSGGPQRNTEYRIAVLEQEQTRLASHLIAAQSAAAETQTVLEATRKELAGEQKGRREAEFELASLQSKNRQLDRIGKEIRRVRDFLQTKVEDLAERLQMAQGALTSREQSLTDAHGRIAHLEEEKERARAALSNAQNKARILEASLAAEQEIWTRLQDALTEVEQSPGRVPK